MKVLLDRFENDSARHLLENEVAERVTKDVDLPATSSPGEQFEKVDILLTRLVLLQTPDTPENLEKIVKQTSNAVRNQIGLKGIRELSVDGIRVEAGYNVLSGWHLVTSIWY